MNKKELIIKSFQNMDLDMLVILLDENKTYQDATKEIFIEKLEIVFSHFKKKGDTLLFPYKGSCNSDECTNKGCSGYSFVGNNSKNHIDLIFQESNDDIEDIFHCNGFENINKSIEKINLITIEIYKDEKATFKPSVDFLIRNQKCKLAFEEIIQYQNKIIDQDIYIPWLEKHYKLYKYFDFPPYFYSDFYKFYSIYYDIKQLTEFLQTSDLSKEALEKYQENEINEEIQLIKWLSKYEHAGLNLALFLFKKNDFEYPEKFDYYQVGEIKIKAFDYVNIAKFKFIFEDHYWKMLDKYSIFSEEEKTRYSNEDGEMSYNISSLTYHLESRGII